MPLTQTDSPIYYLHTGSNTWPVTKDEIKLAFPNTSFPQPFIPPDGYVLVFPAPQPEHNPVTQSVREITPVLTSKGHYEQSWEVVELFATQAERDAAIASDAEAKRLATIPQSVTMRQACQALEDAGLLDDIEAAIAAAPRYVQIDWQRASSVDRSWPTLIALQPVLGLTDAQVDELFVTASKL